METLLLGCPIYDQRINIWASQSIARASRSHRTLTSVTHSSLIPSNCNIIWCEALNRRAEGVTGFAMLHSDVQAEDWWLDTLWGLLIAHDADFVSAVVPMKGRDGPRGGATSTAVAAGRGQLLITQAQIRHESFPDTFDINAAADALERLPDNLRIEHVPREYLLCNTGCMVCRLDRPWCEQAYFDNPNAIEKQGDKFVSYSLSEDWFFSKRIAELGGKVMATKLVRVKHWGLTDFDSHEVWGVNRDV